MGELPLLFTGYSTQENGLALCLGSTVEVALLERAQVIDRPKGTKTLELALTIGL